MDNMESGSIQDFEFFIDALSDRIVKDIHDYFRMTILREFPDLDFEPMGTDSLGWLIMLPQQRTYSHSIVEAACIRTQEELFWKKDTLIRFGIIRDEAELEEEE
jgi:hypothetical protein